MKCLLLLTTLFIGIDLCAQEFQPDINKLAERSPFSILKKDTSKPMLRHPFTMDLKMLAAKPQQLQAGVHALPQDGMPCIVPDTRSIAVMPNVAKNTPVPPANRIPNAARNPTPKEENSAADGSR